MALALVEKLTEKESSLSGSEPLQDFGRGVEVLAAANVAFTGEQFVPGAGVEICYEHYHRYAFATSLIAPTDVVLDLGCGVGYGSLLLSRFAKTVYSLDRDSRCIEALHAAVKKLEIENISPLCMDLTDLGNHPAITPHSVDVVVCHEFIEHIDAPTQRRLVQMIARGEGPFKSTTRFFVSTPEKRAYDDTRADVNPYHLHELSRDEFGELLRSEFKQVRFYWQSRAEANCMFPVFDPADNLPLLSKSLVTYLEWIDREKLFAKLSSTPSGTGVYLYGIASQDELEAPGESLLVDLSSRAIDERLAIAAHELRCNEQKLVDLQAFAKRQLEAEAEEVRRAESATLALQADKIRVLLDDAERLGAENEAERRRAEALTDEIANLNAIIAELQPWKQLVHARLGPNLPAASHQLDVLWSYVAAMGAPGHRFVTWCGKVVGKTLVGRLLRKCLNIVLVIRQA